MAAAPPANTKIGTQATANYRDATGNPQSVSSLRVETIVQQVGSFTLDSVSSVTTTVINTKTGGAGATVYAPHVLTNTGNGTDSFSLSIAAPAAPNGFSQVQVFADANGDGLPDSTTPLCTAVPTATCSVPAQTVAGNNGVFQFVVAYSIPSAATSGTFTSPVAATITATPTTVALYAAGNTSAADKDNVNLTTGASFNATKGLNIPAVAWSANSGTWPTASASGQRSLASCAATIAGASAPAAGCVYTVYTLNFNNSGAAAGMFAITDTVPAGFTYVPGSAVWSSAPGTALADSATGNPAGLDYKASGNTLTAVVSALAPNTSQTISFVVMVNSTATVGYQTTTNTAKYNPIDASGSTSASPIGATSPTNASSFTVTGTFGVVLGSTAGTATAVTSADTSTGVPNATANDTTTLANAVAGSTVKFAQTVFNTGNASDIVNLTAALGSFPAGTTFKFFAADGLTPLSDNNGDGIVDTGPIAAGANATIVVAATLPAMAAATGPFSAIVTGTSAGDSTKSETTRDTISAVIGVLVDLTNTATGNGVNATTGNGDVGTGPSPSPTTTNSTPAGTGTIFSLFVKNNDTVANTYTLAASQTTSFPGSLPTGWTVTFVASGGTCASAAITTVAVAANGGQTQVAACVTPPASQVAVTAKNIYFQIRSTVATSSGAIALDTKTDAVTVTIAATYQATLSPNNTGQLSAGNGVVYAHTLSNTGAQSCAGPYTVSAALSGADASAGWTTALYIDVNGDGQLDPGDTLITGAQAGPLLANGTQHLLVKVFAPGGATTGATDTATVTVTFPTGATSCGTPSATDLSTVVAAQMALVKLQAVDTGCTGSVTPSSSALQYAKPGQCIVYQITATNQGAAAVSNATLNDAVPAFTSMTGATQPATQCSSVNTTPVLSNTNFASTSSGVSCGTATTVQPNGTVTLSFAVKINN